MTIRELEALHTPAKDTRPARPWGRRVAVALLAGAVTGGAAWTAAAMLGAPLGTCHLAGAMVGGFFVLCAIE